MAISPKAAAWVVDPLERAVRTFGQQFIVFLAAAGSTSGLLANQHWLFAVEASALAAGVSILTSVLTFWMPTQTPSMDLFLRVVKTFVQSVVGTMLLNITTDAHIDLTAAVALALPVAGTALLLGLAALGVPATAGVSLLPVTVNSAPLGKDAGTALAVDADDADATVATDDTVNTSDPVVTPGAVDNDPELAKTVLAARAQTDPAHSLDSLNVSDGGAVVASNATRNSPDNQG